MKGKENPYIIQTHCNWNIPDPDPRQVYHQKYLADKFRGLLYLIQFVFSDNDINIRELEEYGYNRAILEELSRNYPREITFLLEKDRIIVSRGIKKNLAPRVLFYGAREDELKKIAEEGIKIREGDSTIPLSCDEDVCLSLARLSSDKPEQVKPVELWVDVEKMIKDGKTILNYCQGPNAYSANEDIGPEYISNIKEAHAIENQYADIPGRISSLVNGLWIQVVACKTYFKARKKFDLTKREERQIGTNWYTYKVQLHAVEVRDEVQYEFILEVSDTSHVYTYRPYVWKGAQVLQYFKTELKVLEKFCIDWFLQQSMMADLVHAQERSFPEKYIKWQQQ